MIVQGKMVEISELNQVHRSRLYSLMNTFYDDATPEAFHRDLEEKDHCILLLDEGGTIQGFSTQKVLRVQAQGRQVTGVFSGDTIIHPEHWGSLELFRVFVRHFIAGRKMDDSQEPFYWFLISKGYKTYKMLPLFFNDFFPDYRRITPAFERAVIHAFGHSRYPDEYDPDTRVIRYAGTKDKLKPGVADVTERHRRDPHVSFFLESNPDYAQGNDLVCLTRLAEDNLNRTAQRLFLGKRQDSSHETGPGP